MKDSIEKKEKDILDYMQEIGNNLLDYCMRNGVTNGTSITVMPPDYVNVDICERYENGKTKTIKQKSMIFGEWGNVVVYNYEREKNE